MLRVNPGLASCEDLAMALCMYVYVHVDISICKYIHTHICTYVHMHGMYINAYTCMHVLGSLSAPVVVSVPVVNLTMNNYNLTIKCLPNQNNYNYNWMRKNDVLPLRAKGTNTSELTIVNLRPEDSGDYQCTISNGIVTISSNFSAIKIKSK